MFNKLFTKILDSSIWLEPLATRIVWITLLAAMDDDGYAHFSAIENLAGRARVSIEEAKRAIECFLSPDPNSGNPNNEGRRVERVPGGFLVLNAAAHRGLINRAVEREQTRLRVQRHRLKKKSVTQPLPNVTPEYENESEIELKRGSKGGIPPNEKEAQQWAAMENVPGEYALKIFTEMEGVGWLDGAGRKIDNFRKYVKGRHSRQQEAKSDETHREYPRPSAKPDRNTGTLNAGRSKDYSNVGKVAPISDAERPST